MKKNKSQLIIALLGLFISQTLLCTKGIAQDDLSDEDSDAPVVMAPTPIPAPIAPNEDQESYEDDSSDYNTDEEMDF